MRSVLGEKPLTSPPRQYEGNFFDGEENIQIIFFFFLLHPSFLHRIFYPSMHILNITTQIALYAESTLQL